MITLRMPFQVGPFIKEREVDFIFKIGTLEDACEDILKCDLDEVEKKDANDVNIAILYAGYNLASEKKRKRNKYSIHHAAYWMEHMSKESQSMFLKAVQDVIGKYQGKGEKKK